MARISKELRRNILIEAALGLFAEKGFDGSTIKDIAQSAGVTEGLIYHYFASKDDLLVAVVERYGFTNDLKQLLSTPTQGAMREQILVLIHRMTALANDRARFVRLMRSEGHRYPSVQRAFQSSMNEAVRLTALFLQRGIDHGEFRSFDTTTGARMLLMCVMYRYFDASKRNGVSKDPLNQSQAELELEMMAEQFVDIFLHGIANTQPQ